MDAATAPKMNSGGSPGNSSVNPSLGGDYVSPENQSDVGTILNQQRRQAGNNGNTENKLDQLKKSVALATDAARAAEGDPSAIARLAKLALSMFRQIEPTKDWPYLFLLLPLSFLKDLFDIAFAAIAGVGIVVSFITTLLLTIFAIVCIILIGEKIASGKSGKYIAGFSVEFITEALPAIGWMPLAFIDTLVIYIFILYDRATTPQEKKAESNQPEPQYADGYAQEEAA